MDEHRIWMEIAVEEAAKSKDEEDGRIHPRVGVVVVKDGKLLAAAHRGEFEVGDHAEYTALERKLGNANLTGATVYATLEPCTKRSFKKTPCAERLRQRNVGQVIIGMLDPNKEIRGKGEWELVEHKIKIGRFDSDLMIRLMDLNRDFIKSQQRLGLQITQPTDGQEWRTKRCTIKGTFINRPGDDVWAIANIGSEWWPQQAVRIIEDEDNAWEVTVGDFGIIAPHKIYIVKANDCGMQLIKYYEKLRGYRSQVIYNVAGRFNLESEAVRMAVAPIYWPFSMPRLPQGFDIEACITLDVTRISPAP